MPKYSVTGWIPTALYATVEVEAPNAQTALELGEPMLAEIGEFEYADNNATCQGCDEIRVESEEATDSAYWAEPNHRHEEWAAAARELKAWAAMMGGWDAPCWSRLDELITKAETVRA